MAVRQPHQPRTTSPESLASPAPNASSEPLVAGFEAANRLGSNAHCVPRPQLAHLALHVHAPGAFHHDLDLLLLPVVVAERLAHVRRQPLEAEAGTLRAKWAAAEPCFNVRGGAELLGRVLHLP